jgi:hypothetical protein
MSHPLRNMMCEAGIGGCHCDDEAMDWAADEILRLRDSQAVCYCGIPMADHTELHGCGVGREMELPCPNQARIAELEEALRPFAEWPCITHTIPDRQGLKMITAHPSEEASFSMGDFRRAADAVAGKESK